MPRLVLENVHKKFGKNRILTGINLAIEDGEMLCLIGASGSGKSTLLRCANLLEPIDDGRILLDGVDISEPGLDARLVRTQMGIVFQSYNLFPHMTAFANAMLAPRRVLRQDADEIASEIELLFKRFNLKDKMHHFPDQLSGGQQQRVAIIRALAMSPEIMLFDEITSALDPELVGEVLDVLRQMRSEDGMTMIFATHEMSFARELADKICFLDGGSILEQGEPESFFENPVHARTKEFLARIG